MKPKNILWIHWFLRTESVIDFFEWTKKNLEKYWINVDCPTFEKWPIIKYKNWENILNNLNMQKYDTVFAHSMWWRVAIEYITEHKIYLNKLLIIATSISWSWTEEVTNFYKDLKHWFKEINKYVKEIIVLYSIDDKVSRVDWAKELVKELWAKNIEVNWYWHFNVTECKLIEDILMDEYKV